MAEDPAPAADATAPATDDTAPAAQLTPPPSGVGPIHDPPPGPSRREARGARVILRVYGTAAGAADAALIAYATGAPDPALVNGFATAGAGLGYGTAHLLTRSDTLTLDGATFTATSGVGGTWLGYEVARSLIPVGSERYDQRLAAAAALGNIAGTGTAIFMSRSAPRAGVSASGLVGTAVGWQTGAGIATLAGLDDPQRAAAAELGTGLLFTIGSAAAVSTAPHAPSAGQMALNLAHGAWLGAWMPLLVTDDPAGADTLAGLQVGLGIGEAGALASGWLPRNRYSVGLQAAGAGLGASLGAGIPLAAGLGAHRRDVVAPMMVGSVAGQAVGALAAPHYHLEHGDGLLIGVVETWTAYQTIGWSLYGDDTTDGVRESGSERSSSSGSTSGGSSTAGYALTSLGAGTLAAFALPEVTDFDAAQAVMTGAGGAWGTWYGAWGAELADAGPADRWLATLLAGDTGLVAAAVAQAGGWHPTWAQAGVINGAGMTGGALGALAGIVVSPNVDSAAGGALVGSTLGLAGGFWLSHPAATPTASATPTRHPARALPFTASFTAMPMPGKHGTTGAFVQLDLHEVARR